MTIKTIMLAGVAGAALLGAMPFSPEPVYAQNNTYVAPDEGQSSDDQSSREMKKRQVQSDDQSSREMKKQRQGQSDEQSSSREMKKDGKANGRRMDRDRHGERMRHREGRFRHYHEGYYYATPWWTTGIVVDGGGIGCRDGARIVSRRGFNRVSAISCGGETYSYRGWRGGDPWRIRIDSDTGRIVSVRPAG